MGAVQHGGSLVPIFALAHEHDPDPEMRPYKGAISAEEREKLIVGAAAAVTGIYRHFEAQRLLERQPFDNATAFRRTVPKIGRNDPCPCGSGKKFKQCCGRTTLHQISSNPSSLDASKQNDRVTLPTRDAKSMKNAFVFGQRSRRVLNPAAKIISSTTRQILDCLNALLAECHEHQRDTWEKCITIS